MDQPHDTGAPNGGHEQSNPQHVDCIRCGYNLHGLTMGGTCPECGTPVARTLHGNLLGHSSPTFLNKLQRGLLYVVISYILSFVVMIIQIPIAFMVGFTTAMSGNDPNLLLIIFGLASSAIALVVGVIALLGWWWVSEPDPDFVGEDSADSTRTTLRVLVAALAITMLLNVPVDIFYWTSDAAAFELASTGVAVIATLIGIAMFFVSLLYIRVIATRIPNRELMLQAGRYLWLLPLIFIVGMCIFIGPLIATIMYIVMLWNVRKQITALQEQQEQDLQPAM